MLAGLAAVILVSFVFSAWARLYAVRQERATLESALGMVTKDVLGTEVTTAHDAQDLLTKDMAQGRLTSAAIWGGGGERGRLSGRGSPFVFAQAPALARRERLREVRIKTSLPPRLRRPRADPRL